MRYRPPIVCRPQVCSRKQTDPVPAGFRSAAVSDPAGMGFPIKVLVTGLTGYIANELAVQLLRLGDHPKLLICVNSVLHTGDLAARQGTTWWALSVQSPVSSDARTCKPWRSTCLAAWKWWWWTCSQAALTQQSKVLTCLHAHGALASPAQPPQLLGLRVQRHCNFSGWRVNAAGSCST